MKTETKQLAALVSLALKNNSFVPVTDAGIQAALNAIEAALQTLPYSNDDPAAIKDNLQQAAGVLSNLMYNLGNNSLRRFSGDQNDLLHRVHTLCKQVSSTRSWYCNTAAIQCDLLPVKTLLKTLRNLNNTLQQNTAVAGIYTFLQPHLHAIQKQKMMPYHRWIWWSHFAVGVANIGEPGIRSLQQLLIKLNFNTGVFINWLIKKLQEEIEEKHSGAERLELVTDMFLWYDRIDSLAGYMPAERSVKQEMISVLQNRLLYLRAIPAHPLQYPQPGVKKINTALSVPQLALFIRLMVDTKMINESNNTALLKSIASVIYTSKAASVSPESLRVNYYTPGTAAKSILKDYLLNMLNLLRSY